MVLLTRVRPAENARGMGMAMLGGFSNGMKFSLLHLAGQGNTSIRSSEGRNTACSSWAGWSSSMDAFSLLTSSTRLKLQSGDEKSPHPLPLEGPRHPPVVEPLNGKKRKRESEEAEIEPGHYPDIFVSQRLARNSGNNADLDEYGLRRDDSGQAYSTSKLHPQAHSAPRGLGYAC